ncbi:Very-long-chain (3R)-3-hydroxyacyl-CoA dehydratase [Balamuthia mandrillaris]
MANTSAANAQRKAGPKSFGAKEAYIVTYNLVQFCGWLWVLWSLEYQFFIKDGGFADAPRPLWSYVALPLQIFQTLAVLEVFHSMLGIVRTPVATTLIQVTSRVFLVWGIAQWVPTAQNHLMLAIMVASWSVTEVVRYLFYALNTVGRVPYFLLWLRYTLFFVLYPSGVSGECGCIVVSLPWIKENGLFSVAMPNAWNVSFDYYYFLLLVLVLYLPGLPKMYLHMVSQRRKALAPPPKKQD